MTHHYLRLHYSFIVHSSSSTLKQTMLFSVYRVGELRLFLRQEGYSTIYCKSNETTPNESLIYCSIVKNMCQLTLSLLLHIQSISLALSRLLYKIHQLLILSHPYNKSTVLFFKSNVFLGSVTKTLQLKCSFRCCFNPIQTHARVVISDSQLSQGQLSIRGTEITLKFAGSSTLIEYNFMNQT